MLMPDPVARGLQGLGGGGLISLAQTIIADIVSPKERPRYQAYIAGVFATSSIAGPVLGGFFAEQLHWSMIFWINLPLGLARLLADQFAPQEAAAPRAAAIGSTCSAPLLMAARDRDADAGAQLGRHPLPLGLAEILALVGGVRRCSGCCSSCACARRRSR